MHIKSQKCRVLLCSALIGVKSLGQEVAVVPLNGGNTPEALAVGLAQDVNQMILFGIHGPNVSPHLQLNTLALMEQLDHIVPLGVL
jgi:hypothetical protein